MNTTFPADYVPNIDPFAEFEVWFQKANESDEIEPTAMHLATFGRFNRPHGRVVLYKGMSSGGLTFFTNYESNKAKDLDSHPIAALTFHWKTLELQIRVEGGVQKVSREESEKYFATRPRESQIGAWASLQSRPLGSRDELELRRQEFEEKFADKDVPCPPHWGGYRVVPDLFEFWMLEPGRLHNRFVYILDKSGWKQVRLNP